MLHRIDLHKHVFRVLLESAFADWESISCFEFVAGNTTIQMLRKTSQRRQNRPLAKTILNYLQLAQFEEIYAAVCVVPLSQTIV